jgi:signal peptidase I
MENEKQISDKKGWQSFWELVRFAFVAAIIVIPIRIFIVEPFVVDGSSMFPTFQNGNYLIADKISYIVNKPNREDVVIFFFPGDKLNDPSRNFVARFFNPGKSFIKRVIGLPNETLDIRDGVVTITNTEHPEGFTLNEPYVKNISHETMHIVLKSDEYFVMGDNRTGSSDSRIWGPVKNNFFEGKALLRLLPINEINILPGKYKQAK